RRIAALLPLAGVVDEELGDFAERASLLAVIGDDADAARLGLPDAFLDAVNEIRAAGADVRAEDVGTVALVMDAAGDPALRIAQARHIADDVNGDVADGRQEDAHVRPGHEFREHAAGLLEQSPPQLAL